MMALYGTYGECSVVEETTISKREVGGSNPSTGSTYSVAYSVSNS